MISKWTLCGFLAVALAAGPATARRHYGIITDLTNSPKESASIDIVTLEAVQNVGYLFKVYASSGPAVALPPVPVPGDFNTFANSTSSPIPNLFTPSGGQAALVSVETVDLQTLILLNKPTVAVLKQRSGTNRILMTLPPEELATGQVFATPVGAIEAGTWIYVAPLELDTAVWVTVNGVLTTSQPIPISAFTVAKIPITTPNSRVEISVAAK